MKYYYYYNFSKAFISYLSLNDINLFNYNMIYNKIKYLID